ncbi:DUF6463 family protein [Nocardia sp. NBC_00508]|uniref:DUF6463 family protein n=1 Tax=Nocardia sp. NBC_00508 TaxID=2975992 RepID=UPI002E80771C|nr:DUF6463 family protein [Nocardia sp. NBC_00508]WUD64556.1 DUF6463 family protein [Nocardia sp. NBC_00508]
MIKWAGRLFVFLGFGHTAASYVLTAPEHADSWFSAELWKPEEGVTEMSPAMASFWLTAGSFGVPLMVLGMVVLWLDRRGIVPPLFIAWTLGIWSVVAAVTLEPAPWALAWVAVGLLAAGVRRARFAESAPQLSGV